MQFKEVTLYLLSGTVTSLGSALQNEFTLLGDDKIPLTEQVTEFSAVMCNSQLVNTGNFVTFKHNNKVFIMINNLPSTTNTCIIPT